MPEQIIYMREIILFLQMCCLMPGSVSKSQEQHGDGKAETSEVHRPIMKQNHSQCRPSCDLEPSPSSVIYPGTAGTVVTFCLQKVKL